MNDNIEEMKIKIAQLQEAEQEERDYKHDKINHKKVEFLNLFINGLGEAGEKEYREGLKDKKWATYWEWLKTTRNNNIDKEWDEYKLKYEIDDSRLNDIRNKKVQICSDYLIEEYGLSSEEAIRIAIAGIDCNVCINVKDYKEHHETL